MRIRGRQLVRRRHRVWLLAACTSSSLLTLGPGGIGVAPASAAAYFGEQWGLPAIGLSPAVWQSYGTGSGIRIGIVDTGVDPNQSDLAGKVLAQQYFVSGPASQCAQSAPSQNPAADDNGHGTHVAGIAAASGAVGVYGAAPGASLVVAKVLDCTGSGADQDVIDGINWAVSQGARVINLSLGTAAILGIDASQIQGSPLGTALQDAWAAGAIPVIAGGNIGGGLLGLGNANFQGVPAVVVAATGSPYNSPPETDQLACYSNQVDQADWGVAAPGGDNQTGGCPSPSNPTCGSYDKYEILSTYWTSANPTGCYATDEGTSMATPFVSGLLALLLSRGLTPSQAVQTLLNTANHSVSCGSACSGMVNAAAALQAAAALHPSSPAPAPAASHPTSASTSSAPSRATVAPTTSSSTTSSSTTSTQPHPVVAAGTGHRAIAAGAHGNTWWLVLPILVGLGGAAALGYVARRRLLLRHAVLGAVDDGLDGEPPVSESWPEPT